MAERSVLIPWRRRSAEYAREPGGAVAAPSAAGGRLAAGPLILARLVMTAAVLIALLIGLAILLRDVDTNPGNTIVKGLHDGANFFAGPFTGLASFHGHPKQAITVDWGIALIAYLLAGAIVAAAIARIGRRTRARRRHMANPAV